MLSPRVPHDYSPNEITKLLLAKRRAGAEILDLTESNPTRAGLPGAGTAELQALADPRAARYDPDPRGLPAAREAIARYYAERAGAPGGESPVGPDDLVLAASTSEAYAHLFRLLCEPGEEVLAPRPSYPLFEPLASLEGIKVETYRLDYASGWRLDLDSLKAAAGSRTRALILVQPNNPTGSCLGAEEIARVEEICAARRIALISDEVFGDYAWPPAKAPLPSLTGPRGALTFVLSGLSKLCGMPQMKLAWIAVQGPSAARREALEGLEWIADLFLSVGTPVQWALPRLLKARSGFHGRVMRRLAANLDRLRGPGNGTPGLGVLGGDGGWSAVVSASGSEPDFALRALRDRDVLLHPGHYYELANDSLGVLSLLPEPSTFDEALKRLESLP